MADERRIQANIDALKQISESGEGGITRIGFTSEYRDGAEYFKSQMEKAGLSVREDTIGNVYGRLEGTEMGRPAIVSGSHLDTVRCAGAYDGIAGAVCALEVARMLKESQIALKHPYEVMGIIEEEGTRFGQVLLGSKFTAGQFQDQDKDVIKDPLSGQTLRQVLETYAYPDACPVLRQTDEIEAFLELHDEQGPLLETEGMDIGIVDNIVAISWLTVTVTGFAGHAGTVPMPLRQDAATGAAKLISQIAAYANKNFAYSATATVGKLQLIPGSSNCIPSKCIFTVDLRSGKMANIEKLTQYIKEQALEIAMECSVDIRVNIDSRQEPIEMDSGIRNLLKHSCEKLGYSYRNIDSGAGHDSMVFSSRWPTAMIFVPCVKGITHNPEEYVHPEYLAKGADVLYETIIALNRKI